MIAAPTETPKATTLDLTTTPKDTNRLGSTLEPGKSALRNWLTETDNTQQSKAGRIKIYFRRRKWKKIGWEVLERKALLLAAAKDLDNNNISVPVKLAATDIFVEKAQKILTTRGKWLYFFGTTTAALAAATLMATAWHIYHLNPLELLQIDKSKDHVSAEYLTILILKSTTAGALIASVAYWLASLSRALLHEATVLYSRRHSLRFGRLFVYLMSDSMTREDLEKVFNWNAEFSTAFKDIQPENLTKSPTSPAELAKAVAELYKAIDKKATDSTSTEAA
jgi:hypothetical protein